MQKLVRVPGAARDYSPRVNFQFRLHALTVFEQPPCATACVNINARVKKLLTLAASCTTVWRHTHILHALVQWVERLLRRL